jgi:hypothetical protein
VSGARRERLLFLLLAIVQAAPIWMVRRLPMQDLPQHLAKLRALISIDDPAMGLQALYRIAWLPAPYVSFYAFGAGVGAWLGTDVAVRLWLTLYAVAFPLAVRYWLQQVRPGAPALAWWGLALVFHPFYYLGFTNLLMGLPLCFLGLALVARDLAGRGSRASRLLAGAVALLIYLTHPFVFLLFGFVVLLHAATARVDRRARLRALAALVPAAIAFAVWGVALSRAGTFAAPPREATGILWYPPWTTAEYLGRFLAGPYASPGKDLAALAWLGAALGVTLLRPRAERDARGSAPWSFPRLAALAGGVALLMFLLPFKFTYANYINLRPAPFLAALLIAVLPVQRVGGIGGRVLAAALALVLLAIATVYHLKLDRELLPFETVLARMEPGKRVLPLVFDSEGESFRGDWFLDPLLHVPAYYHAEKGGAGPYFQALTLFPVMLRPEVRLPAPSEYDPESFTWEEYSSSYDYFLAYRPDGPTRSTLLRHARLLAADSGWMLFGRREPPAPAAAVGATAGEPLPG